jgi:hypothetical protein
VSITHNSEEEGVKQMASAEQIVIPRINRKAVDVPIVGDSVLVCHKWSEKAKRQMLDKQMKKAKTARAAKDPEQEFQDSLYRHPDGGYGFPAVAFKCAAVSACRYADMKMTVARGAFHVNGELVNLEVDEPVMREDMVRIAMGTADIRYRGSFPLWRTKLSVTYNADVFSLEQIFNLFNLAGFGVGVGEHRPEKNGSWGRFHVATEQEMW